MFVCYFCEKEIQGITVVVDERHLAHISCDKKNKVEKAKTKWDNLGFLDGLKGHVRPEVAALYESCKTTKLVENLETGELEGVCIDD